MHIVPETLLLLESLSFIDDDLISSAADYNNRPLKRFEYKRKPLIAAIIVVIVAVLICASCLAALSFKAVFNGSKKTQIGSEYEILYSSKTVSDRDFKGESENIRSRIRENFKSYRQFDSRFSGSFEAVFSDINEVNDYLGIDYFSYPEIFRNKETVLLVNGNQKGEFENVAAMASANKEGNTIWITGRIIVDQKEASIEQITSIHTADDLDFRYKNYDYQNSTMLIVSAFDAQNKCKYVDVYFVSEPCFYDIHVICNNWTEKQAEEYVTELTEAFYAE